MQEKGIYCLVFENPEVELRAGALGVIRFSAGWHIYVGSALGNAGFSRVKRHIRLSERKDRAPRWHVDYLLLSPDFSLRKVYCGATAERLECSLAGRLDGDCVPGFGCSDCRCVSHLFQREGNPSEEIISALGDLGLPVHMKNIK